MYFSKLVTNPTNLHDYVEWKNGLDLSWGCSDTPSRPICVRLSLVPNFDPKQSLFEPDGLQGLGRMQEQVYYMPARDVNDLKQHLWLMCGLGCSVQLLTTCDANDSKTCANVNENHTCSNYISYFVISSAWFSFNLYFCLNLTFSVVNIIVT